MRSGLVIGIVVILEHGSHQSHQPHLSHGWWWSATHRSGTITPMAAPPASTKTSLQQRLSARTRERWPELAGIDIKFQGEFAYVTGRLKDDDTQPLMRLRYGGSAARWGFAIYLASNDGYQDSSLPTGAFAGLRPLPGQPHRLDLNPPTNLQARPLSCGFCSAADCSATG
jgi:hypothetical protein